MDLSMTKQHLGIRIDLSRDQLLSDFGIKTLQDRYLLETESSPQEAFARAAIEYADDLEHAQRIYDYASKLWFMYSTPILSNGGSAKGAPISCFLSISPDSRRGLSDHYDENIWLASNGGGIGGYWGAVRADGTKTSNGVKSTGAIPFLKVVDAQMMAFNQGSSRRGSYAAYLDISHPEIEEFIVVRKPTGGDANRKCLNLHNAVNITDDFMQLIEKCINNPEQNDSWDLIDPHTKKVVKTVSARELWMRIIETRVQTGEPYIHFIDRSNEHLPPSQKLKGLKVHQSNLCVAGDTIITVKSDKYQVIYDIPIYKVDEYRVMFDDLEVLSYNIKTGQHEFKLISNFAMTQRSASMMKITDDKTGKFIKCTPEHKILTKNRGYVMAKELLENDELIID